MRYDVIVIDPPWAYGSKETKGRNTAESQYMTLGANGKEVNRKTGEGITAIAAAFDLRSFAAATCHVYMWATNPKLPFAFELLRLWGMEYKTTLTWVKTRADGDVSGGGMGWFYRGATEHILYGVRGDAKIPSSLRQPNVIKAATTGHSVKPLAFYQLLKRVHPNTRRLDVFARQSHEGFDGWGNEYSKALADTNGGGEVRHGS